MVMMQQSMRKLGASLELNCCNSMACLCMSHVWCIIADRYLIAACLGKRQQQWYSAAAAALAAALCCRNTEIDWLSGCDGLTGGLE